MKILGISAFYHDAAAAIIEDGEILAAAQEERFTRIKHDPCFPARAIRYCLDHAGCSIDELDAVVFYDKPLLKFERLLETYYAFAPKGIASFVRGMPGWLNEKLFLKSMIRTALEAVEPYSKKDLRLLFAEHHLSHAASAFFASSFSESAILTIDGVGEWATASICKGSGNKIEYLKELKFPHSPGLLYSAFTYWLGFRVNSGEYKLMGLAPYGNPDSAQVDRFIWTIKSQLVDIRPDGSMWLNQDYFTYATGLRMVDDKKWAQLFGFSRRLPDHELEQVHCDLALAIQMVTEEVVLNMAREARRLTQSSHICLAGGVALNGVANGKIFKEKIFDRIFVQPAAGDAGGAPGAALAAYYMYFNQPRKVNPLLPDLMQGALLGPEYSDLEIQKNIRRHDAHWTLYAPFGELTEKVAHELKNGKVVGWFQGRMEFGPRALGNRSILGDASNVEMQRKLNLKIKFRESFRPFAPSVPEQDVSKYFELDVPSPYMLLMANVQSSYRKPLDAHYNALPWREKLMVQRSGLPAVTHVDLSARIQTVTKQGNERYWELLKKFEEQTGRSVLVNTSFNVRGEPIVCTPEEAYLCFMKTEMDLLVMGNMVFEKHKQGPLKQHSSTRAKLPSAIGTDKTMETSLVITTGLLILWFVYKTEWILFASLLIGLLSLMSGTFAGIIAAAWKKIADILGWVMPKVLLSVVFYLVLTPVALVSRLFTKDALGLKRKNKEESYWIEHVHLLKPEDFEKTW